MFRCVWRGPVRERATRTFYVGGEIARSASKKFMLSGHFWGLGHFRFRLWDRGGTLSFPLGGTYPRTPVSGGTDETHVVFELVLYDSRTLIP